MNGTYVLEISVNPPSDSLEVGDPDYSVLLDVGIITQRKVVYYELGVPLVVDLNPPNNSFLVTHNLGFFPSVTVVDTTKEVMSVKVDYVSSNSVRISSNASFSGTAYLN